MSVVRTVRSLYRNPPSQKGDERQEKITIEKDQRREGASCDQTTGIIPNSTLNGPFFEQSPLA
jgi:hypothetical protein